ncbi:MAG: hypothetical protein JNN18_23895 [Rubrivivax sp.]|nr:hypothetical protein [Rubrivivax sp.]
MTLTDLLDEADRLLHPDAGPGTRAGLDRTIESPCGPHRMRVTMRVDARGRRREQIVCDGRRMERHVALRLTCPDSACPQARHVQERWRAWHAPVAADTRRAGPPALPPAAVLMQERTLVVAGHWCVARPARYACRTRCPNRTHEPLTVFRTGYDLFADGLCIGGGVVSESGSCRPRLPTLAAAEAHVFARSLEASAWLAAALDPTPGGA